MVPLKLTIQGLYSYQKKQSINFTRLTNAHIFGIFGAVGSGKSTVLEAITFALFGKTDRLNLSGDNRNYNMMNLKSNELYIEFIFIAGNENTEYMATVKGRRNSKQFDDVKSLDRAAYKKSNGQWEPIGPEALETTLGLSYENFKRTVIIPQGKFQEFLQLSNKERSQMMKELFNLEKFELFNKVAFLESKNNKQLQTIEGKLQQLGDLNPEQVDAIQNNIHILTGETAQKANELAALQSKEAAFAKLKDISEKINNLKITLQQLSLEKPKFTVLEQQIKKYEYCLLNFKALLDAKTKISANINRVETELRADENALTSVNQKVQEAEKSFEKAKQDFDTRECLKQQAEELDKIFKIQQLTLSATQLEARIVKGEEVCRESDRQMDQLKLQLESAQKALKGLRDQYPDMSILSKVKEWYTVRHILADSHETLSKELQIVNNEAASLDAEIKKLATSFFKDIPEPATHQEITDMLTLHKQELTQSIEIIEKSITHYGVKAALEEYAANLEEGKPCPLCGALSHPDVLNPENISESLLQAQQQKELLKKDMASLDLAQKKFTVTFARLKTKTDQVAQIKEKQTLTSEKIKTHQSLFTWNEYQNEEAVKQAFQMAEQLQKNIKIKEGEIEKQTATLTSETQKREKSYELLEGLKRQLISANTETATLKSQLQLLVFETFEKEQPEAIQNSKSTLLKKYAEIEQIYQTTGQQIIAFRTEHDTIAGRLEANRKSLAQELISQQENQGQLEQQLNRSPYQTMDEVHKIISQELNVEKSKKEIDEFKKSLDVTEKQLSTLQDEMGGQTYDAASHLALSTSIKQLTEEINNKNQEIGRLENELKKLTENLKSQVELKEQFAALQARADNIKTLKQLFKASGFVNYISSVYLQELCNSANDRFYKLTRQRLSIEITPDNNFLVRDFMNGGKTRSVKTLSGGQTFQAALSLALALADNIKEITGSSQNFFFLDEGFGLLDKESLEIVFDTLKSLRRENRIVGVISHVEDMQQEIETYLKVTNDENNGSIIAASWEQ